MRKVCVAVVIALAATMSVAAPALAKPKTKKKGPATAQLTFAGATGLAGLATSPQIRCNSPSAAAGSSSIFILDQPPDQAVLFNMNFTKGKVTVGVYAGSGTTFVGRTFEGTGVKGFNAARGAQIDSTLTETTASNPTLNPGTLGAITSIKGTIECGDQTPGTATVTFTGDTAEGAIKGRASPFRVECDNSATNGNTVQMSGVVKVGRAKAQVIATFGPDSIVVFEVFPGPPAVQHQYVVKAAGVSTLSGTGAQLNGTAVEQSPASGTAHTLQLAGKVTCGTIVNN